VRWVRELAYRQSPIRRGELFLTDASPRSTLDKSSLTPILPLASPHLTSSPTLTILLSFSYHNILKIIAMLIEKIDKN